MTPDPVFFTDPWATYDILNSIDIVSHNSHCSRSSLVQRTELRLKSTSQTSSGKSMSSRRRVKWIKQTRYAETRPRPDKAIALESCTFFLTPDEEEEYLSMPTEESFHRGGSRIKSGRAIRSLL